jgi:DDE superfamily endonuclease
MDEELMLQWVDKVWRPSVAQFDHSYLLLDCCTSHLTTAVKAAFDNCNTEVDFILKGYTCKLQPMDVGINKPVKKLHQSSFRRVVDCKRWEETEAARCCLVDLEWVVPVK